jgi:hypothetical protein
VAAQQLQEFANICKGSFEAIDDVPQLDRNRLTRGNSS